MLVRDDCPLIGIILRIEGQEVVRYFTEEAEADAATPPGATQEALRLAGAWGDLDWDETEWGLDRIRRESRPSPPVSS